MDEKRLKEADRNLNRALLALAEVFTFSVDPCLVHVARLKAAELSRLAEGCGGLEGGEFEEQTVSFVAELFGDCGVGKGFDRHRELGDEPFKGRFSRGIDHC